MAANMNPIEDVPHAEAAWEWFRSMGSPALWVAPMVDQSELAFRMLCREHGATGAYTPMLHARLFLEGAAYREEHFTTCEGDRPLLAQFCANDPEILLKAAKIVEPHVDGVDLNLGCPQRIARRGRYGAFLMDDLPLVERMVKNLSQNLGKPVTVKIRRFPEVEKTIEYAKMLERAGASLIAIHGRTRDQKRAKECLAEWEYLSAVKKALRVPVIGNGNIQTSEDVHRCMKETGVDGVMSAESLLSDPALFSPKRLDPDGKFTDKCGPPLLLEYLDYVGKYHTPFRMIKGHAFKLLGPWLNEFIDLRDELNREIRTPEALRKLTEELMKRVEETGRDHSIPKLSEKQLARMEAEAALKAAIEEQDREEAGLKKLKTDGSFNPESTQVNNGGSSNGTVVAVEEDSKAEKEPSAAVAVA